MDSFLITIKVVPDTYLGLKIMGQTPITPALLKDNGFVEDFRNGHLMFVKRGLAMIVSDDGCGFDVASTQSASGVHLGLQSMRSRAEKIGGKFAVRSVPGRGTEVKVLLRG